MNLRTETPSTNPTIRYRLSAVPALQRTGTAPEGDESGWLRKGVSADTSHSIPLVDANQFPSAVVAAEQAAPHAGPRSASVNGVVVRFDAITVTCELIIGESPIEVDLPRPLFNFQVTRGLPITLSMIEDQGIRQPRITIRDMDAQVGRDINAQAAAILEGF